MFKKTVLTNGLRILTAPMKGTNTVTVLVMCETGSDNETEKERGISHFLEHMFFKGTKRRKTSRIISHELDSMGSSSNAFTSHEYTGYYIKAGHVHLPRALDILADIYRNSLLDAKEIDRERQVIVEEMHMYLDTPSDYIWSVYEELLYGNQHAGWDVIGTESHIRGFSPEEFRGYFDSQYTSKNTAVIIAGNIDEKKTISDVADLFTGIRAGTPRPRAPFHEAQSSPALAIRKKETDQTHIAVGFRGVSAGDPDRHAADMLSIILGGSMSARMWNTVRERLGLAYAVHTSSTNYSNRGHVTTYAGVAHENAEKTLKAIMREYAAVAEKGVTAKELSRAKDFIKGRTLLGLESSSAVANFVGIEEVITGKPYTIDEVFATIDALSVADIGRVARRLIRPEAINCVILGPHASPTSFQNIISGV